MKTDPITYLIDTYGRGARFVFMPNGGNLGDNLIAAATIQQFEKYSLNWTLMKGGKEGLLPGDVLLYGGGGSLVDLYAGGIACLEFLSTMDRPIVVLPQTVKGHEDFWKRATNITVFCRDIKSEKFLDKFSHIKTFLSDDMAVGLDMNTPEYHPVIEYRSRINKVGALGEELNVFREDEESGIKNKVINSLDLSDIAYPSMKSAAEIKSMAVLFLMSVASFRIVNTDRLHVTVAAALVGAETNMYDNSYGKNRDVFLFSINEKFKNVRFIS